MRIFLRYFSLIAVIVTMLSGCSIPGLKGPGSTGTKPAGNENIIKATDGTSQIKAPRDWKADSGLNDKANLQASNRFKEQYLIVLSENREDFAGIDLAKHSEITRGLLTKSLKNIKLEGPKELTINGAPAVQYVIYGEVSNLNAVYIHTTVETEKYFHQVLAWTLKSKFDDNKPVLEEVINSFQELKPEAK